MFRCSVTDAGDAAELYRAVWRYTDSGLSVMERRLSPVSRMSVELILGAHHLLVTPTAERSFIRSVWDVVAPNLLDVVNRNHLPSAALTAFVLRPPPTAAYGRTYWIHWPALAVSNKEFTPDWCNGNWGRRAVRVLRTERRPQAVAAVRVRGDRAAQHHQFRACVRLRGVRG